MAYTQTSQGVLQDDPQDSDFLRVVRGTSFLNPALASAQQAFHQFPLQYQVPTFEAGIDMVVGRETYLLGADPYLPGSIENYAEFFNLKGRSGFTQPVPVHLRVTVVLNGAVVQQFIASNPHSPKTVRLSGFCLPIPALGSELLYGQSLLTRAQPVFGGNPASISFTFDQPGKYLVRAELVRDHPLFRNSPALLQPTGLAVDVRGEVIVTKKPKVLVVSIVGPGKDHDTFADLVETHLVPPITQNMQFAMAMPSGPGDVTFVSSDALSGNRFAFPAIMAFLELSKRYSNVLSQPDRIVVVVEEDKFQQFLPPLAGVPAGTLGLRSGMAKSSVFVKGPLLVSNSLGYIAPAPLLQQRVSEVVMHELLHSFDNWSPKSTSEMGDCQVAPYHNVGIMGTSAGIASGIDLKSLDKRTFFQEMDLMQGYEEGFTRYAGQCTYRHSLDALSQGAIDPPVLMVSGLITGSVLSAEVELAPIYQMDGFNELPRNGDGNWAIVLRGDFGQVLARHPFQPKFQAGLRGAEELYFNFTVDEPLGLRKVEIVAPSYRFGAPPEGVVVASRELSDHAPEVNAWATPVLLNRWQVDWQGSDLDGDSLLYTVLTSTDGELFVPTEVYEEGRTSVTLSDPDRSLRKIKIIVTDGGRSAEQTLEI